MTSLILTEYQEQCMVVEYLELLQAQGKVLVFSAVPNNTWTKSWSQLRKQKMEGVRPGVPDLIIVTKDTVLFLEMKRTKNGTLSSEQKNWNKSLNTCTYVKAFVAKGFDEAKVILDGEL